MVRRLKVKSLSISAWAWPGRGGATYEAEREKETERAKEGVVRGAMTPPSMTKLPDGTNCLVNCKI